MSWTNRRTLFLLALTIKSSKKHQNLELIVMAAMRCGWLMCCLFSVCRCVLQAGGSLGEDCRFSVRHRRCADDRSARARHRLQLQLLLSSWDWSGGDAVAELQSRDQLPLSARHARAAHEEELVERVVVWPRRARGGPLGDARPIGPQAELQSAPQQQHQRHEHRDWRLTTSDGCAAPTAAPRPAVPVTVCARSAPDPIWTASASDSVLLYLGCFRVSYPAKK